MTSELHAGLVLKVTHYNPAYKGTVSLVRVAFPAVKLARSSIAKPVTHLPAVYGFTCNMMALCSPAAGGVQG